MTPKSLLRHPLAASTVSDLVDGRFEFVMDDPSLPGSPETVTRVVFCSGKVYYDAVTAKERPQAEHVALGRIELLYPFPEDAVSELIARYPSVREIVWLQEEPMNMGARKWVVPQLMELAPEWTTVRYLARTERSSPAEGYLIKHQAEQQRLVAAALGPQDTIRSR